MDGNVKDGHKKILLHLLKNIDMQCAIIIKGDRNKEYNLMKNYFRTITEFPFAVKWFLITEMLFGLSIGIWNVSLNFHLKSLGLNEIQIGGALAFGSICTAIFSLFAGEFGDRLGFHPAMVIGCILKGSGIVVIALSPNIFCIFFGLLIISFGDSLVLSSEFPFLLSLIEEKHRHTVYNLLISSFLFAMFIGNISGGFMSSWSHNPSRPYLLSIVLSGCFFISLGIARGFLPKERAERIPRKLFIYLLKEPKILMFLLYGVLTGVVFNLVGSMINIIFRDQFKLTDSQVGIAFSVNTLVACSAAFIVPIIISKFKASGMATLAQIFITIILVVMAFSPFKIFVVFWILWSFFRTMLPGTVDSSMLQSVSPEQQGAYSGLRIFSTNIGVGAGAYAAGSILMFSNYSMIMIAAAIAAFIQLIVFYFGCRKFL